MKINVFTTLTIIIVISIINSACGTNDNSVNEKTSELKVAAASDLTHAFTEVGQLFEEETGVALTFSFGSTGQLADQIENGAPFDIFAAANIDFVDQLNEKDLIISDTQTTYAFGRIGIATLHDQTISIETLDDLLKEEVRKVAIANPDHAPYGLAAKQSLEEADIWEALQGKLVYGRNISDTLAYIETGNVEAGIIALSLYQEDQVDFHIINDDLHEPLEQSIAVINRTSEEELAREFIQFILGPVGKPIMERYGFVVPE
ncbi:molybdate ABC transporter substrate-binding protein [Alkalihalobacterium chitinilyticum]|uniref:Molybdate ABC transporter substrate-binding protein n=1 Tax=Alkalihalobacterium chitinilyticum TaxID=2980103 RepID=A0ABT5VDN3_9BACI|nr:molybdate ABC transporter substrate-binding protein [Alkalihalobacterium chitinilyticum]MDE5413370.1 molybdate ABC transporter substrate-binding protein [Alkalihalobacterium chitinilyticum]